MPNYGITKTGHVKNNPPNMANIAAYLPGGLNQDNTSVKNFAKLVSC